MSDVLSRREQDTPINDEDDRLKGREVQILMTGKDDQIRLVPPVKIAVNHMEPEVEWIEGRPENPFSEDPLKDL